MELRTLNENHVTSWCKFSLLKHDITSGFCFLYLCVGKEKAHMEEHF